MSSPSSKNLFDDVNRTLGANLSDADRKKTIEERVLRRRGLETWQRSEIVVRIIAHARECHVNRGAVVCPERDPQVEPEGSVGKTFDPVAAAGEDPASKTVA